MEVGMFERTLKQAGAVVSGVGRDQLDNPTPCDEWKVRQVLNHLIGGLETFASGAAGTAVDMDATDYSSGDYVDAFERVSKSALEAFSTADAMEKSFTLPWGDTPGQVAFGLALSDAAVHGWDLAKGTDQE
ncbi:MAG: hypothetical protein QOK47_492, partial [Actinomycetota bacterium]|nr:hypothetical protein [Actinomycetota bacterium]